MIIPNLKDEIINGKKVRFKFYRSQNLYYETESGFLFPVPLSDIGDATFLAEDRAILFMRYIRKQIDDIKSEKEKIVNAYPIYNKASDLIPLSIDEIDEIGGSASRLRVRD
jgi:hypothetical protein